MRRRSERKKSTDVSSPAPASRRTNRRRKSNSVSEDDKNLESNNEFKNEKPLGDVEMSSAERDSSEERSDGKRRRSSRMRTPIKELRSSPMKRRTRRDASPESKISTIVEEENGAPNSENESNRDDVNKRSKRQINENSKTNQKGDDTLSFMQKNNKNVCEESKQNENTSKDNISQSKEAKDNDQEKGISKHENDCEYGSSIKSDKNEILDKEDQDEVKLHTRDNSPRSRSSSSERKQPKNKGIENNNDDEPEEGEVIEKAYKSDDEGNGRTEVRERFLKRHSIEVATAAKDEYKDHHKSEEVNNTQDGKNNESSNTTAAADTGRHNAAANTTTRKRRWITKKATESKEQVLAISTDSLKTLIADVHPVPLSDVQLESSSEVEEVASEREEGEQSPSPEPERRRDSTERVEKSSKPITKPVKENSRQVNHVAAGVGTVRASIQRSPSPARNQSSNVLYITNLVRPFTVLQLKGLLARTGKIVENGFWIDRIKSKCYVEYESEDQAIETRHALHGVRWPASNPKCLNVDFGIKNDMLKAIESTKEDVPKFGQETNKENLLIGSGWSRERHEDDKKSSRPVREWDVGKKENLEREKPTRDVDRRRERSRERSQDRSRDRSRDRNMSRNRDNERIERERDRRHKREKNVRSNSLSPARKQKKKEDPPLRLLDDLFRKTKATPCIYWLPLTPEQIAEKEAFRQKRLEEQKQRLKQREMEREKEREKERNRQNDRDRDRDYRRVIRSSERRRSRSRDRRRY